MKFMKILIFLGIFICLHIDRGYCDITTPEEDNDVAVESVPYESPNVGGPGVYLSEHFDNPDKFEKKWIRSQAKKPEVEEELAKYDGKWELQSQERFPLKGDIGLVLMSQSRHSAISAKFDKPFRFDKQQKPFIVQYVVTFQNNHDCGGAYLKLLTEGTTKDLTQFNDKTPYSIMFGPDKCGGISKMHFIIRHKNPINGTIVEKHCTKLKVDEAIFKEHLPTLFKLVIKPNDDFAFYLNNELQYEGNLLSEDTFEPPILPPKEIVDTTDEKPKDWDDKPMIPDPDDTKPDDWDDEVPIEIEDPKAVKPDGWLENESAFIPDETAKKPEDWDEETDGEWELPLTDNPACKDAVGCGPWSPPMIPNPEYKGQWKQRMIANPNYKGAWQPRKIPNPDYFHQTNPLSASPIDAVGFELWSLVNKIYFDDILITDDENIANEWTMKTWQIKKLNVARESTGLIKTIFQLTHDYPILWALYIVILAIIVGSIGYVAVCKKKDTDKSCPKKMDNCDDYTDAPEERDDNDYGVENAEDEIRNSADPDEDTDYDKVEDVQTDGSCPPSPARRRRTRKD